MAHEEIKISFFEKMPLCTCEKCNCEFVLINVIRGTNKHGEQYENIMYAAATEFCPRCGEKWIDNRRSTVSTDESLN